MEKTIMKNKKNKKNITITNNVKNAKINNPGINNPNNSAKPAKKVFVFGNEYLAEDSFARKVSAHMKNAEIVHCRSPDDLLDEKGKIIILDVVRNIKEPMIITDVGQLRKNKMVSMHDFDLSFFLNLMKGIGEPKEIKIIGIPSEGREQDIARRVDAWI